MPVLLAPLPQAGLWAWPRAIHCGCGPPQVLSPSTGVGHEMKFIGSEVGKEVIKEEMTH